ncbi:MAG: ybdK 6 [Thermoleophilia bacterium]|nr:ybdK 6 [Thermoleophilia bacterium]
MPDLHFEHSEPLTLGIEEEFVLVDAADGVTPAPRADEILDGEYQTIASPGGWMKAELLRTSVELTTAANRDLLQLDVDLRALRDELAARVEAAGMQACGIGMHPTLVADASIVTPSEAHGAIAELHARVGTLGDQVTHGIHVHVGQPSLEDAIRTMDALAGCVPLFIACTANSPIVAGVRSPWRSARSEVLRRMLWAGPAPRFHDVAEYRAVHALHQLENSGPQRFLWEVAPVPALGTVEVRSFDASPNADVALSMAALVQAIAALVLDGQELPRASDSLERHNRWSAMEFGSRARFLVVGRDDPVDVAILVRELVERVRPYARDLGNEAWLAPIDGLLDHPPCDDVIDAFESGGAAAALAACQVKADVTVDATDPVDA